METGSLLHNGSVLHGKFKQKPSDTGSSTSYLDHACALWNMLTYHIHRFYSRCHSHSGSSWKQNLYPALILGLFLVVGGSSSILESKNCWLRLENI